MFDIICNFLRSLVGMLYGPADLLGFRFEIISIIFSFVQSDIKNEPWLVGGKYSKKVLYENDTD